MGGGVNSKKVDVHLYLISIETTTVHLRKNGTALDFLRGVAHVSSSVFLVEKNTCWSDISVARGTSSGRLVRLRRVTRGHQIWCLRF